MVDFFVFFLTVLRHTGMKCTVLGTSSAVLDQAADHCVLRSVLLSKQDADLKDFFQINFKQMRKKTWLQFLILKYCPENRKKVSQWESFILRIVIVITVISIRKQDFAAIR